MAMSHVSVAYCPQCFMSHDTPMSHKSLYFSPPCPISLSPMSHIRNAHVTLSVLRVKGHTVGGWSVAGIIGRIPGRYLVPLSGYLLPRARPTSAYTTFIPGHFSCSFCMFGSGPDRRRAYPGPGPFFATAPSTQSLICGRRQPSPRRSIPGASHNVWKGGGGQPRGGGHSHGPS